jgi:hypothetical protein
VVLLAIAGVLLPGGASAESTRTLTFVSGPDWKTFTNDPGPKSFILTGHPTNGVIYISADDFAQVRVNGSAVGSIGSVTDIGLAAAAQSSLTAFDISSLLKPGMNVVTVNGQNGPPSFSPFCAAICTYSQTQAGVVFGGSLSFVQVP